MIQAALPKMLEATGGSINSYADPVEARKNFLARQPMGAWPKPTKLHPSWCTWPATNRCLLPASCSRWTVAWPY